MLLVLTAVLFSAQQAPVDTARVRAVFQAGRRAIDSIDRAHHRTVRLPGFNMHYLEWGPRTGVPLVWAHGSASTGYEIRHLAPRLVELGYRVIAPSYRGHGQTTVPSFEFTIWHVADDMVALLDTLKIRKAVFGGSSKGGFVAAAVYDQYPDRVSGLLLSDGGSWSNQWDFDHNGIEGAKRQVAGGVPPGIVGDSAFDVFSKGMGGAIARGANPPADRVLEMLVTISRRPDGKWQAWQGFGEMMGTSETYLAGTTAPSKLPMLQWSQHAMMPLAVFRNLDVPLFIIDPQNEPDDLPMTDQNAKLAADHPKHVVHKIYKETGHAAFRERPDWFVRDAGELLGLVRAASR